jgi:hypothetical protein
MKNCLHCKHADWVKTKAGKLHPTGNGKCAYPWKMPPLPASMYWMGQNDTIPCGGWINRKTELKDHCTYYARDES